MDRLPNESAPAYAAFKVYLGMGPGRTVRETCRRVAKSWQLISKWSSKHRWLERARLFDKRMDQITREAEEAKLVKRAGVWAKRMEETREEAFQLAGKLIEKAEAMLAFPLAQTTSADGKTTVKPARWNFSDAARMADVAARLKQLATGLPTERLEHSGPDGAPMTSLAMQINVAAIQARVTAAVEAQEKVDLFLARGIMKVPGGDGGVTPEQSTDGDDGTNGSDS